MKLGVSTYSLFGALQAGTMNVLDVIDWVAELGGEHVEIVPLGFDLHKNPELVDQIRERAAARRIDISNYAIGANFASDSGIDFEAEVERVIREVEIAARLGVKLMRHDVASSPDISQENFDREFIRLVEACRRIADAAKPYGITTSVENHGYFIQHSSRVDALVTGVNRSNFRTTLDVGNFMCVDELPSSAVQRNLEIASMVHVKDFYVRPKVQPPGEGWFPTSHGNWLRGAIVGHGDIPMWDIVKMIKASGYDGYISLEFEGLEECRQGTRIGLENVKRIWNAV